MDSTPDLVDIEVSRLRLDVRNPRLSAVPDSQRDALGEMSEVQGAKLVALCRHISQHGLNPTQRFIVIPDDDNQFIVLDGNRRLTALRVLDNPELAIHRLSDTELRQLKQIAASYTPIEAAPAAVFKKREDADVWIALIHGGESDGAGSVPWSAQQKARHKARAGTKAPHLQVLEFVFNEGKLSDQATQIYERGRYPVSTLERALTTPYVRDQLGIELAEGQVVTHYPKSEVLKGLTKLVDEIGSGTVKVKAFMSSADRVAYIDSYKEEELPSHGTQNETKAPLSDAPDKPKSSAPGSNRDRLASTARVKLVPTAFSIAIPIARINDIYLELKRKLPVDNVPNATGVLFRVFLELSIDDYMERFGIAPPKRDTFANRAEAVASFMEANGVLSKKALLTVREALQSETKLTLPTNLNALVHNRRMAVSGNDLKFLWTRMEDFVKALWTDEESE